MIDIDYCLLFGLCVEKIVTKVRCVDNDLSVLLKPVIGSVHKRFA